MRKRGSVGWDESFSRERQDIGIVEFWLIKTLKLDGITSSSLSQQKYMDIDLIAEKNLEPIPIEVKIRYEDYGDFLLETVSNTSTHSLGWIYATKAELLAYVVVDRLEREVRKGYILNVKELRKWWIKEGRYLVFPKKYGKTDGLYETLNYAIPWKKIPLNIFIYAPNYDYVKEYFGESDWEK